MLEYLNVRVAGYRDTLEGIEALDPPEEVVDLHETFLEIMGKILVAEEARAEVAETINSVDELNIVWEGPAGQAVNAAEREAIVLCYAAQSRFDETQDRAAFADAPWMPSELKEVVRVALNCP